MKKQVLIFGGSGLIGSNLILSKLGQSDEKIFVVSRTGLRKALIDEVEKKVHKIELFPSLESLPRKLKFEEIYHLGFSSQPSIFTKMKLETLDQNIMVLPLLLQRCSSRGVIVYASSSEIYNGCQDVPCSESHLGDFKNESRSDYMLAKLTSERYLELAHEEDIRILNLRISLVYGPQVRRDDSRVLYKFLIDSFTKGKIKIEGNPSSLRSYLFIDDFIYALNALLQREARGTFNVSNFEQVSILDLAKKISEITEVPVEVSGGLDSIGAPYNVHVDSKKLINLIGQFNKTSLEVGLKITSDWLKRTYF